MCDEDIDIRITELSEAVISRLNQAILGAWEYLRQQNCFLSSFKCDIIMYEATYCFLKINYELMFAFCFLTSEPINLEECL